jgi:hypothetical protein
MLEVEAVSQSYVTLVKIGLSIALYMRRLLPVESSDLRPSNHCILVRVFPSRFCFVKMCKNKELN